MRNSEKPNILTCVVSIQILQYEFLGPIPLSEWGPPMGDILYLVLSRDKDRFNMLYVGDCKYTDDKAFFVQHKQFKCWVEKAGSDSALYLAVLPLKDSESKRRQLILRRILSAYRPLCNPDSDMLEKKPSYNIRKMDDDSNRVAVDDCSTDDDDCSTDDDQIKTNTLSDTAKDDSVVSAQKVVPCPCCGSDMNIEKTVGKNSVLYRCNVCNMSDTRIL